MLTTVPSDTAQSGWTGVELQSDALPSELRSRFHWFSDHPQKIYMMLSFVTANDSSTHPHSDDLNPLHLIRITKHVTQ